jgi:restriction endonuclease S subunit
MGGFEFSVGVNANNIFLVNHSELEGRLDIDYYRPAINALEKKIRAKSTKKLKDFIVKIASGATPSVQEEALFYSDEKNGIPFLRVQNLNDSGELGLNDVKYINQETHEKYLKRSQVTEHNLLVKITGVGRMAIASVAPKGFIGNTNQHMVVIKTNSEEQSSYLSNYLNLDITEALASRRATGATRPALDYPALKSIPIVENIDFSVLKKAEVLKQQKEKQAQALLDGVDGYLLNELGITLPEQDNRLEKRMFIVPLREVTGARLDPLNYLTKHFKLLGGKYNNQNLSKLANISKGQSITSSEVVSGKYPVIAGGKSSPYSHNQCNSNGNVITVSASGAYAGYVWYHENPLFASDCMVVQSIDEEALSTLYLAELLKLKQAEIYNLQQGAGQPHVYASDLKHLDIPLPSLEKQNEIATHISNVRAQAKQLQTEAAQTLSVAKVQIERMILGDATIVANS